MKKTLLFCAAAITISATSVNASTLDIVKERDTVRCGISTGFAGLSAPDDAGNWTGLDVDYCRSIAAAVLGDANKVEFIPLSSKNRLESLKSGEIDVLSRTTTWTFSRDNSLGLNFAGVNFYDGQGFMVPASLGISSVKELDGASICIQTGTTTEINLSEYFKLNGLTYEPVPIESPAQARASYLASRCDAYTTDSLGLASQRSVFVDQTQQVILPEIISKEPLGPVVRHGDDQWLDIVKWTHNVLLAAEESNITSINLDQRGSNENDPAAQALLGTNNAKLGAMLGLDVKWAYNVIKQVENHGEIFELNSFAKEVVLPRLMQCVSLDPVIFNFKLTV
ncbi:MAG: amino acid ABC transporter substrate-binding protein [Oceanospirillaceae bacterium]